MASRTVSGLHILKERVKVQKREASEGSFSLCFLLRNTLYHYGNLLRGYYSYSAAFHSGVVH